MPRISLKGDSYLIRQFIPFLLAEKGHFNAISYMRIVKYTRCTPIVPFVHIDNELAVMFKTLSEVIFGCERMEKVLVPGGVHRTVRHTPISL